MKAKFNFVLFDFDNTLVDSSHIHAEAFELVLKSRGYMTPFTYESVKGLETVLAFISLGFSEFEAKGLSRLKRDAYFSISSKREPRWMEGISEFIFKLRDYKICFAIVSSGSRDRIINTLVELNAMNLFEFIVSREDVINQKPASEPYRTAIRKSGRELNQILAVEDSESGIASAIGAGLTVWELSKRPKSNSLELLGDALELEDWFFQ